MKLRGIDYDPPPLNIWRLSRHNNRFESPGPGGAMLITYHRKRSDDYRVTMIHTKPLKKKLPNVDFRKYRHGDTYNTEEAACAHGWEYIEDRIANDFEEYRESELNAV